MILDIPNYDVTSFVACLAIGVLTEIRKGNLQPTVATWSVAVPRFVDPIERNTRVPPELVAVLREFDELGTIQRSIPEEFEPAIDNLLGRLEAILRDVNKPVFEASWQTELTKPVL